jgi:hypothetical protein
VATARAVHDQGSHDDDAAVAATALGPTSAQALAVGSFPELAAESPSTCRAPWPPPLLMQRAAVEKSASEVCARAPPTQRLDHRRRARRIVAVDEEESTNRRPPWPAARSPLEGEMAPPYRASWVYDRAAAAGAGAVSGEDRRRRVADPRDASGRDGLSWEQWRERCVEPFQRLERTRAESEARAEALVNECVTLLDEQRSEHRHL